MLPRVGFSYEMKYFPERIFFYDPLYMSNLKWVKICQLQPQLHHIDHFGGQYLSYSLIDFGKIGEIWNHISVFKNLRGSTAF